MNVRMWEHQKNKENINKLKSFGYQLLGQKLEIWLVENMVKGKMTEPKIF